MKTNFKFCKILLFHRSRAGPHQGHPVVCLGETMPKMRGELLLTAPWQPHPQVKPFSRPRKRNNWSRQSFAQLTLGLVHVLYNFCHLQSEGKEQSMGRACLVKYLTLDLFSNLFFNLSHSVSSLSNYKISYRIMSVNFTLYLLCATLPDV